MIQNLRAAYTLPSKHKLAGEYIDAIHREMNDNAKEAPSGKKSFYPWMDGAMPATSG